jgi:hypothetical protein
VTALCFKGKKEEGRRKKEEGRRKREEGRRKKEEGRRKKEEGKLFPLPTLNSKFPIKT